VVYAGVRQVSHPQDRNVSVNHHPPSSTDRANALRGVLVWFRRWCGVWLTIPRRAPPIISGFQRVSKMISVIETTICEGFELSATRLVGETRGGEGCVCGVVFWSQF
jgi:hypothetical protein